MKIFNLGGGRESEGGKIISTFHFPPSTKRTAFTLIEMIGVMAIMGILAAIVIPPMIARVETSDAEKEDANLEEIARALLAGIKAEGRIPNPDVNPTASQGWASMASTYSVLGSNAVLRSVIRSTNDTTRRFFLSPQLTNFLNGSYSAGSTWGISNFPNSAYFVLLSVSKDDMQFAGTCRTNANLASNDIVWLQNWAQIYNTAGRVIADNLNIVGTIAGSSARWTNRGQFLHLKIVNLRDLFCRVDLYDRHSPVSFSTPLNNSSGDKPTQSEIYSSGFKIYISDTNANNWENGISLISQPSENSLSLFQNKVKKSDWREMIISIPTVKNNGSPTNYSLSLAAPDGPFFSVNSASTNQITFFGNPNSSSAIRKDSTNFYVLYGSSIKLLDNSGTNSQIVFKVKEDTTYSFINGSWQK
jgi:prepilin-type N-terminal cleavage/methylation domain-containing protein